MPGPGAVIREALRVDWSAVTSGRGLTAATGVWVPLGGALALGDPVAGVTLAAGALPVGVASLTRAAGPPLGTMLATSLGMALSTFVGAATGAHSGLHLALLAGWAFGGGLMAAFGPGASLVGLQAVIAIVVFGRFAEPVPGAARLAGFVLAGGAVQLLLAGLVRWAPLGRTERRMVARAYRSLADLADGGPAASGLPASEAIDEASGLLESTIWSGPAWERMRGLLLEAERIRLELLALAAPAPTEGNDGPAGAVRAAAGRALAAVADRLDPPGRAPARSRGPLPPVDLAAPASASPAVVARARALAGQLRAAGALAGREGGGRSSLRLPGAGRAGPRAPMRAADQLRSNLGRRSTAFRHAVRMGAGVTLASVIAAHSPLQRGYWVALTTAIVLKPDFGATITRGVARLAGTSAGVVLASLLAAALHPTGAALCALVAVLSWAAYATFRASYTVFSVFVTGLVVFLLSVVTPGPVSTAADRLVDTLIGGALALVLYLVWPTWAEADARRALARLVGAEKPFLEAVLGAHARGGTTSAAEAAELRRLVRALRLARSNAEAAVARSVAEPSGHRLDPRAGRDALAALRRVSLSGYSLAVDLTAAGPARPERPALGPLRAALVQALDRIEEAALGAGGGAEPPPLRRLHDDMAAAERHDDMAATERHDDMAATERHDDMAATERRGDTAGGDASWERVVEQTDELVDAVDTAAFALGAWRTEQRSIPR